MSATVTTLEEHDFDVRARFKIANIQQFFEAAPEKKPSVYTQTFGPRLKIRISAGESKDMAVYLYVPDANALSRPVTIRFTFTATSYSGQIVYGTQSSHYTYDKNTGYGYPSFLTSEHWLAHESLRSDNGVILLVTVRSPLLPTPRSPAVLDVLHNTVVHAAAVTASSNVRFTVFDRRKRSGRLAGQRVLHVDRRVIAEGCDFLGKGESVYFRVNTLLKSKRAILPSDLIRSPVGRGTPRFRVRCRHVSTWRSR